jgi:hypothetical protein
MCTSDDCLCEIRLELTLDTSYSHNDIFRLVY